MFPILGLIAAGVTSALTAGEAAVIAASVGAATAIGTNALSKKNRKVPDDNAGDNYEINEQFLREAFTEALEIAKRRNKNR
jgi:hypothetical protein